MEKKEKSTNERLDNNSDVSEDTARELNEEDFTVKRKTKTPRI